MRPVKIKWTDAHRYLYQMGPEEEMETVTIESVGWLVKEDEKTIVIGQDDIDGDVRGVQAIPKVNVLKFTRL